MLFIISSQTRHSYYNSVDFCPMFSLFMEVYLSCLNVNRICFLFGSAQPYTESFGGITSSVNDVGHKVAFEKNG